MKNILKYLAIAAFTIGLSSCEDFLSPMDEDLVGEDYATTDPASSEGILMNAYTALINQYTYTCMATDDAVSNDNNNAYRRMATGELTAQFNPINRWNKYESVLYVNKFLETMDNVVWKEDEIENELYARRMRGEALALRALHHFYILENFAGKDESGALLGIPYIKRFINFDEDFDLERLSFEASVDSIMKDFEDAFQLLPYVYSDDPADIPAKDAHFDQATYLSVNSSAYNQRINGQIIRALQARVKLFAASPSFLNSQAAYGEAAAYAAGVLDKSENGFVLAPEGIEYYDSDGDANNSDILWRQSAHAINSNQEENNFPPSLNGRGNVNPTQNLVDAFYMSDGYPIGESPNIAYDIQNPYMNRDSRLSAYVLYNGGNIGGKTINTTGTDELDGVNAVTNLSTRTGYYLKKLLRPDVVIPASGTPTGQRHYNTYIRYTELFLILAEAQNEIGGPDHTVAGSTMSAKEIMRAIRDRAMGLASDPYLDGITTKDDMRSLIQNERRLELCFEGFRFFDMRRWGLPLNETVKGLYDDGTGNGYVLIDVEERAFGEAKHLYLPLPYNEILKYPEIQQNAGW